MIKRALAVQEVSYILAQLVQSKKGIQHSIHTVIANVTLIKVTFIQNRNKKSEWLAILESDSTLTEQEIVSESMEMLGQYRSVLQDDQIYY